MKNILIPVIAVLFLCSCSSKQNKQTLSADTVEVFRLRKETIGKTLSLPAELHPWQRAEVYAKTKGYVRELKVDIGNRVKKNDVLLVLDAPEVTADYARSAANSQAAQSRYKSSLDIYMRTVIAAKEKGAVSESEMERTKNQMLTDSANYEAVKAGTEAYAQLKNYLVVRAAFDGVITQRHVDIGSLVGTAQTPLLVLESIGRLRLQIAVPESYTSALPESSSVSFTVDAQPSKKYSATLARKSNEIDEKTRTELWEFEAENVDNELKAGMYGNVNLKFKRSEATYVVPYSSVVTTLERRFVIHVNKGKAEWVDIRNGINANDKMEIFGNLQEGDLLLVKANDEIKEGSPIPYIKIKELSSR